MNYLRRFKASPLLPSMGPSVKELVQPANILKIPEEWFRTWFDYPMKSGVISNIAYTEITIPQPPKDLPTSSSEKENGTSSDNVKPVTLVLAHGYGLGSSMWAVNIQDFARIHGVTRIICFDWPGMGASHRLVGKQSPRRTSKADKVDALGSFTLRDFLQARNLDLEGKEASDAEKVLKTILSECNQEKSSPFLSKATTRVSSFFNSKPTPDSTTTSSTATSTSTSSTCSSSPAWTSSEAVSFFTSPVLTLFDTLGIDQCVLVGHSLGGYLSAVFALQHPSRIQSLILASPVGLAGSLKDAGATKALLRSSRAGTRLLARVWDSGFTVQAVPRFLPQRHARKLVRPVTDRIFSEQLHLLTPEQRRTIHDYMYRITVAPASGEHALNSVLALGFNALQPPTSLSRRMGMSSPSPTTAPITSNLPESLEDAAALSLLISEVDASKPILESDFESELDNPTTDTEGNEMFNQASVSSVYAADTPLMVQARMPLEDVLADLPFHTHFIYGEYDWLLRPEVLPVLAQNELQKGRMPRETLVELSAKLSAFWKARTALHDAKKELSVARDIHNKMKKNFISAGIVAQKETAKQATIEAEYAAKMKKKKASGLPEDISMSTFRATGDSIRHARDAEMFKMEQEVIKAETVCSLASARADDAANSHDEALLHISRMLTDAGVLSILPKAGHHLYSNNTEAFADAVKFAMMKALTVGAGPVRAAMPEMTEGDNTAFPVHHLAPPTILLNRVRTPKANPLPPSETRAQTFSNPSSSSSQTHHQTSSKFSQPNSTKTQQRALSSLSINASSLSDISSLHLSSLPASRTSRTPCRFARMLYSDEELDSFGRSRHVIFQGSKPSIYLRFNRRTSRGRGFSEKRVFVLKTHSKVTNQTTVSKNPFYQSAPAATNSLSPQLMSFCQKILCENARRIVPLIRTMKEMVNQNRLQL